MRTFLFLSLLTITLIFAFLSSSFSATGNNETLILSDTGTVSNTATGTVSSTVAGTGTLTIDIPNAIGVMWVLDLDNCEADSTDHLDVYIQTKLGDDWIDVVHFTQLDGNSSDTSYFVGKSCANTAETMFENASALAESTIRHLLGRYFRMRYVVTDGGDGDALFTFRVFCVPM